MRAKIALLFLLIVFACAPQTAQVLTDMPASPEIQEIHLRTESGGTQMVIQGERPMLYTSFRLSSPERFVVDIAGVGLGRFTEQIAGVGAIRGVQPRGGVRNQGSQMEIVLAEPSEASVRSEGNNLIVEMTPARPAVTKTAPPSAPKASASAVTLLATPQPVVELPPVVSKVLPPAKLLKQVRFERKEGLQLLITADGLLLPKPEMLDKNRLIIDLPEIKPAMKLATLLVSDPLVKQLRMGQHPDKIRLVLDLLAPVAYAFRQTDNDLIVYLRPATLDQKQETSQAPPPTPALVAVETVPPPPSAPIVVVASAPVEPPPPDLQVTEKVPAPTLALVKDGTPLSSKPEAEGPRYTGSKLSLDFQDADVVNVLRLIGDVSGSNMVIGEDVKGKVNLKLENVPWDQALDIILKTHGLGQINAGNIIRVGSLVTMTQQQKDEAKAKESREQAEDLETRIVAINYSKATDLSGSVKKSLSPRGDITVDDRTNTLIVRDIPKNLVEVDSLARRLDTPTPQVMIEARIVQVVPSFNRSLGIQWGANYSDVYNANRFGIGSVTPSKQGFGAGTPDFAINLPASPTFGGVGFSFGRLTSNPFNLDLRLSAGESQGLTRVVSRPKVTVLDNQKAKIAQGEKIPYQTTSDKGTQTTFIDATLSLEVTPHISADGGVMMNIDITKDAPGPVLPGAPGPSILKKSASTNVLVRDGETTVVGGIYEKSEAEAEDGVPFLKKLPGVGWLFKTVQKRENVSELLVFITPKIVKQDGVDKQDRGKQ